MKIDLHYRGWEDPPSELEKAVEKILEPLWPLELLFGGLLLLILMIILF